MTCPPPSIIPLVVDEQGLPVTLLLSAGQASDMAAVPDLLAGRPTPAAVVADRGYDSNAVIDLIVRSGAQASIPRACPQLRQMMAAASWMAARKFRASLS
jgi:transposase